ncbi:hypothetical protein ACIF83_16505 [Streptomyces sp. NPDC085866]|uniref:hypothetical protein n=1 Tax=Streptomyces sp. NPDC085866 TaxID=3365736 RepID=UPI0037D01648
MRSSKEQAMQQRIDSLQDNVRALMLGFERLLKVTDLLIETTPDEVKPKAKELVHLAKRAYALSKTEEEFAQERANQTRQ